MGRLEHLAALQQYKPELIPDNNLKNIRVGKKITQRDVANFCGTSIKEVCQVEIGMMSPISKKQGNFREWIMKASFLLDVPVEDIFPRDICKLAGGQLAEEKDSVGLNHAYNVGYLEDYEKNIDMEKVKQILRSNLNLKDFSIISRKFFLDMSIDHIARLEHVSRARIGQKVKYIIGRIRMSKACVALREIYTD